LTNLIQNFEDHGQGVAHNGGLRVLALIVGYPHDHVRRVDQRFLVEGRSNFAGDLEVDLVGDGLVGQVVLAGHREAEVAGGDDPVVMLDDDVIGVTSCSLPPDAKEIKLFSSSPGQSKLEYFRVELFIWF